MNDIKKGALVRLKSGGPTMTVCSDRDEDAVYCQWFMNSKLESGQFALAVLTVQADASVGQSRYCQQPSEV